MSKTKEVVDAGVRDLTKVLRPPAKSEIRAFAKELLSAVKEELKTGGIVSGSVGPLMDMGFDMHENIVQKKLQSLIDEISHS